MPSPDDQYIPGVCNIGPAEIRKRLVIGWAGLVTTSALWAMFIVLRFAPPWRLVLFFPASLATIGFLQAAWHFCAKFGLRGVVNFGPGVGQTDTVDEAEYRRQDRRTALKIVGLAVLVGVLVAGAAYFTSR